LQEREKRQLFIHIHKHEYSLAHDPHTDAGYAQKQHLSNGPANLFLKQLVLMEVFFRLKYENVRALSINIVSQ
jgi:hypothetical protein